jgi:hypothetical protein
MMEREIVDLLSGEIFKETGKSSGKEQNIIIRDAISETAKILVQEYGSDIKYKQKGEVDVRRFSNISQLDVYWLMYFQNIEDAVGGVYSKNICESFLNNRYSVNAQHKKLGIDFQNSLSGDKKENPKDKRNFLQKYVTERGKPRYEDAE